MGRPYYWIALEQVPPVLPVWEEIAEVLHDLGYSVVTGIAKSEQFGAPQYRRRAVLLARLGQSVSHARTDALSVLQSEPAENWTQVSCRGYRWLNR